MLDFGLNLLRLPRKVALTIAGSDPSGGAGLQADLKTFHQFGVYGTSVVTLITVQNSCTIESITLLDADLVQKQLNTVQQDIPAQAVKTGALGRASIIEVVAEWARDSKVPLVVDPVMISTHGTLLLEQDAIMVLKEQLLPHCFLLTPNLHEAAALTGLDVQEKDSMQEAARRIADFGVQNVLIKGGHLSNDAVDLLLSGDEVHEFDAERIHSTHTHGTGCTYSAAITALLAKGSPLRDAVNEAKRFITEAIRTAPGLGKGHGPVNLHARTETYNP